MSEMDVADGPDRESPLRIATAYHEAGHAVVAHSLGRMIQKVTIKPGRSAWGQSRLGVCELQKGRSKASRNQREDEVLILFAGMVAEARHTGQYCPEGAGQDLALIERILCDQVGTVKQHERLHRRLLDKTEHLLHDDQHWRAVELVASELLEKETIRGRTVRHFFDQAQYA